MRVVVTGASGYLGSALLNLLEAKGIHTIALTNSSSPATESDYIHTIPLSCMNEVLPNAPDIIFHLAAYIPQDYTLPDPRLFDTQVQLTSKLINLFPQARFIYASSVSVYGNQSGTITETLEIKEPSNYALSKIAGEFTVQNLSENYGIIRFASLIGPGMRKGTFIPTLVDDATKNNYIELWGDGLRVQSYMHVYDAAQLALEAGLARYGKNLYLGAGWNNHSDRDVINIMSQLLPGLEVRHKSAPPSNQRLFNNQTTQSSLTFKPTKTLHMTLKEMIEHAL
ncbi:NAD-dependent epimerase/dehydratase family protein [Bdellovibrio bacteriovorus]|uniref:UDP-glucose 4-epimerase n=1 Tax=Bdellovibrio bacteriovorus str. Tiberius TaxID=1069642 RepID=K7ZFB5_BDEBC|nr:NAD(P)-dependent oxidoreductase [Bdellovibrio bacteriovorus]AFY01362.1 UDP-glucose 4-epimerase [Bdellovibrio bacteriovorus str. Tiberius]